MKSAAYVLTQSTPKDATAPIAQAANKAQKAIKPKVDKEKRAHDILNTARIGTKVKIDSKDSETLVDAAAEIDDLYKTNKKWASAIDALI